MRKSTLLALAAIALVGCGGGGGSTAPGTSQVSFFVSDSLDSNDQVWVTIHKVELIGTAGNVTMFDDSTGVTVDLKTLRDGAGAKFLLLARKSVPVGTYSGVRFTLDKDLTIFPAGSATGNSKSFHDSDSDPEKSILDVTFATPKTVAAGDDKITADFDLASWTDDGSGINAVIRKVEDNGVDNPLRHVSEDYKGVVSAFNLIAKTFTISRAGSTLNVSFDATTKIFNSNGAASPAVADGKRVEIRGAFDPVTKVIKAAVIKIEDGAESHNPEIRGAASAIDASAGTLDLTLGHASAMQPDRKLVHVATTGTTLYRVRSGALSDKAAFFAALVTGGEVEVEGTYNRETGIFTASKIKLEDEGGDDHGGGGHEGEHHDVELLGIPSNIVGSDGTCTLTVGSWYGLPLTPGAVFSVVTTANTEYFGLSHTTMSKSAFVAGLAIHQLEAKGTASGTVLTATRLKYED
ncbi:MAG: DUF4382 domain-containing protein [Armatimonadetes bacterium]|nr:DUF4382 domain-containing protein [Armatimonadota bacterium]